MPERPNALLRQLVIVAVMVAMAVPALAAASMAAESIPVLSPLTWSVLARPVVPVLGSDGLIHLGYEVLFTNTSDTTVKNLIPGSIKVAESQFASRGQLIGSLGNSGNSDAPHLHFQVMTRGQPLAATGLPFVFRKWTQQGRLIGTLVDVNDALKSGQPPLIDLGGSGPRRDAMPLVLDLVGFR